MKEVQFLDHEAPFSHFEDLTIQQIVVNHVRFLGYQFSDDMSGGRWERLPLGSGAMVEKWVPDRRAVIFHSVDYLVIVCEPYFDDEARKGMVEASDWYAKEIQPSQDEDEDSNRRRTVLLLYAKRRFKVISHWLARSGWLSGSKGLEDTI